MHPTSQGNSGGGDNPIATTVYPSTSLRNHNHKRGNRERSVHPLPPTTTDEDGQVAPSELGILMQSLGGNPTQAQLKAVIAKDNLTSPFDFPRFLRDAFQVLCDTFKVLDKDNIGVVSVSELHYILTNICKKLEPAKFDKWIREVDVGSDGKIRYKDFIARMVAK